VRPSYNPSATDQKAELIRLVNRLRELCEGRDLGPQTIGTTETMLPHSLGGVPKDVFVGTPDANAVVWQSRAADDTYVYLTASAGCTAHVWVI
jgi:hypothetical protein